MKRYKSLFNESILDIPKDNLCPLLWDENKLLKPEVKSFIVETFSSWKEKLNIKFNIINMILIGSSGSYQYSSDSDVDVNVTIKNLSEQELETIVKILPNGNIIPNTEHPLNFYLTIDNKAVEQSDNAYDILNDQWIKAPKKRNTTLPFSYILEIAKLFMSSIDLKIEEFLADSKELEYYQQLLQSQTETNNQEIEKRIVFKKEEILADKDALRLMKYLVHSFRKEAFDNKYNVKFSINIEGDNPNFSINNAIYKILEKFGYYEKINKIIDEE